MGFSNGNYCKIKEVVEKKDNYTICHLTIGRKNKVTQNFELNFTGRVRFVGDAHKSVPLKDQRIKITSCDVTNCFIQDDKLQFTKNPQYVVFGYELQESQGASAPQFQNPYDNGVNFEDLSSDDSSLPF